MKKYLIFISLILLTLVFNINNVFAYGISANSQTIELGKDVYVYFNTSGMYGQIIGYSNNTGILNGGNVKFAEKYSNKTVTFQFTATGVGTTSVCVSAYDEDAYNDDQSDFTANPCILINVVSAPTYTEPIDVNRTYSENNYLSALGIDGYEIKFDKETLEYSIEVDNKVDKINLTATAEDNTASIAGVGEMELAEGKNTFNVTVTAENGNQRVYVVNVLVKELNPTPVKIDKKTYYLVKKEDKLPELDNYIKKTIKIGDEEIPALKGKITKYTLVGLRDDKGDIALYIYDAKDKSYTLYNEIKFNSLSLYFMENNKNSYKKTTIKIDGKEVIAYKKSGLDYYLIYGMNLNTGKVNWYTYDKEEGTIQKYAEGNKVNTIDDNKYNLLVYTLASISGLLTFFMMILFIKYKKKMN